MSHQTLASRQFWLPAKQAEARAAHSLSVRSSSRSAFPLSKRQRLQTLCSSTKTNEGETIRKALGSIVIETNEDLPDPPESDFWEGGAWEVCLPLSAERSADSLVSCFICKSYREYADQF